MRVTTAVLAVRGARRSASRAGAVWVTDKGYPQRVTSLTPLSSTGAGVTPDPVDTIVCREATVATRPQERIVVVDDVSGALLSGLSRPDLDGQVRVHCDLLGDEEHVRAVTAGLRPAAAWHAELSEPLLGGATLVALRLPKSLAALDEIAEAVARYADPDVRLLAGGRVKHMTYGMNKALSRHFDTVRASLGQQKSRVLLASGPRRPERLSYPRCEELDGGLTVCAHGAAFAGSSVDAGTALLAAHLDRLAPTATEIVDLGCGTGVLATLVARQRPTACVLAVDESVAACRSATATAAANGVADRVRVLRADVLTGIPDASVDVVVCNPPFHRGTSRDTDAAFRMLLDAGRALKPAGELWTVYNSHLPYLTSLRRIVGRTTVVAQTPRYTLTRSVAAASRA